MIDKDKIQDNYILRRWLDFKRGHGKYTVYLYGIINLLLLVSIKFDIDILILLPLIVLYFPFASLLGYFDRIYLMSTEIDMVWKQNKTIKNMSNRIDEIDKKIDRLILQNNIKK